MNEPRDQSDHQALVKVLHERIEACTSASHEPDPRLGGEMLDSLCPLLAAMGIDRVTVHYDGAGDEGIIEEIEVEPETVAIEADLKELVEEFAFAILPSGFEINDGSFGRIVISPGRSPRVEVDHSIRISEESPYYID